MKVDFLFYDVIDQFIRLKVIGCLLDPRLKIYTLDNSPFTILDLDDQSFLLIVSRKLISLS